MNSLISVIIPTYRNRGGLIKAIDSVLSQDYPNKEVIVVDDNNPKTQERYDTESLMKMYSDFPNVKYIKHDKNSNGSTARNTGVKYAKGYIICFLDDDDSFLKDKLIIQYNYLINSNFDGVYCGSKYKNTRYHEFLEGDLSRDLLLLKTRMYTPTLMFYRNVVEDLNGFDTSYKRHQDFEFLLRFFNKGYRIGCIKDCLVEIGVNKGENFIRGKQLDTLKTKFFEDFREIIEELDTKYYGFKKEVYLVHYFYNLISHLKNYKLLLALRIFLRLLFIDPIGLLKLSYKKIL